MQYQIVFKAQINIFDHDITQFIYQGCISK